MSTFLTRALGGAFLARLLRTFLRFLFRATPFVIYVIAGLLLTRCASTKQCAVFTGEGRITYVMGNENFPTEKIPSVKLPNSDNM